MTSTHGLHAPRWEPEWSRLPPHVATYPNPPMYFRKVPAETYTHPQIYPNPQSQRDPEHQVWYSKWLTQQPDWRDEHYRFDTKFPIMRKFEFYQGTTAPPYTRSADIYDKPTWRQEYVRQGCPVSETMRARAIYRTHFYGKDPNLYPFSNAMTTTQYKRPVTNVYGPMLRDDYKGVHSMRNRHGFMPTLDYY